MSDITLIWFNKKLMCQDYVYIITIISNFIVKRGDAIDFKICAYFAFKH